MIDGVIEQAGVPLQELWEKEGGTGTYPPPSLHVSNTETVCRISTGLNNLI